MNGRPQGGRVLMTVGLLLLIPITAVLAQPPGRVTRPRSVYDDMQLFSQVLNQLRTNHPDSLDTHTLMMAAIEGMVRAADPHSYVLPAMRLAPEKLKAYEDGKLVSVPVTFEYLDGAPVVLGVRPGTEASNLDILPGDELIAIDGNPVTAESEAELHIAMGGEEGSFVTLSLERSRNGATTVVRRMVKRERVEASSGVVAALMLDSLTGYLRMAHFLHESGAEAFHEARSMLERRGMTRLVLDLRDNGGGLVDQAAAIAGEFLPKGALVYTSAGAKPEVFDTVTVRRSHARRDAPMPTVVMVNEGTASAAELLTAALQDHDRALILGRPTFGKSLLMMGLPLTDGSLIMLTVGHVITPCGRVLQRRYRGLRLRDYFRRAGAVPDTTGRPSCRTAGGRKVWGGGGIYPDVVLPAADAGPDWFEDDHMDDGRLLLRWAGGLDSTVVRAGTPEELANTVLPHGVVREFADFARAAGVPLPDDALEDGSLPIVLARAIAWARWGETGLYTFTALRDPQVARAVASMPEAQALVRR